MILKNREGEDEWMGVEKFNGDDAPNGMVHPMERRRSLGLRVFRINLRDSIVIIMRVDREEDGKRKRDSVV